MGTAPEMVCPLRIEMYDKDTNNLEDEKRQLSNTGFQRIIKSNHIDFITRVLTVIVYIPEL